MFKDLWEKILRMFGKNTDTKDTESRSKYTARYEEIDGVNFTAIFANKLATFAVCESNVDVSEDNKRGELLQEIVNRLWLNIKKSTARLLGTGGVIIVPFVANGKLYYDIISQDRMTISKQVGEDIISATILADTVTIKSQIYHRWVSYDIENGILTIQNKATCNDRQVELSNVPQWESISPEFKIQNVHQMPFAYIKSPVDNRKQSDEYGVPITYGTDSIICEILECLKQIKEEFESKKVKIFADERIATKNDKNEYVAPSKVFLLLKGTGDSKGSLIDVFDPSFRDSSYYNRLQHLFEMLEKAVGTSKGVLTESTTQGATATEIKRSCYDTFAIIESIRKSLEKGIGEFCYACDVLANFYNLTPHGDYDVAFSWSYTLVENSQEQWQQLLDGQSMGVIKKSEIRQYMHPAETLEDAEKAVKEITETEQSIAPMLGDEQGVFNDKTTINDVEETIDATVTKSLNGAQTQSLINIVLQYQGGTLTKQQAINIISVSIGVSKEEAEALIAEV